MSATEDDTELRDLLIQNLENSGVLNRLKAEMRAAVFLALEEQDKLENKSPLVNESLKKCLNTEDGRLVAGLIVDFLQVFNLDFSLAVFQPETNSMNSVDRQLVCSKLGLCESDPTRTSPLLLELVRRQRHTHTSTEVVQEDAHTQGPCEDGRSSQADWKDSAAARGTDEQQQQQQALDSRSCGGLDDPDEGEDSFFDDPLPKPDRTYGWKDDSRTRDQESDRRRAGSPEGNRSALTSRDKRPIRNVDDRTGSLHLDDDVEYDDDFNSHRSDLSKSELSIGEEIEEVSIEGPENSDKCDDTQDLSVSQLSQSHADYMEDVS